MAHGRSSTKTRERESRRTAPRNGAHDAASLEARDDAASLERSRPVAARRSGGGAGIGGGRSSGSTRHRPRATGAKPGENRPGVPRRAAGPAEAPDWRREP